MITLKYYVYLLLDPTDYYKPFYVGKGSGDRMFVHLRENREDNPFKNNKIAKIRSQNEEPVAMKWEDNLAENDAYELESQLIRRFGRRRIDEGGILTNICEDNRPPSAAGREVSSETREKIASKQRGESNHRFGKTWSDEDKAERSRASIENGNKPPVQSGPMPEAQKKKISEANKGRKWSEESKAKASLNRKGKKHAPHSAETIEKIRASNIGLTKRKRTNQEREIQSERVRLYWENLSPEDRAKRNAWRNKGKSDPLS